TLGSMGFFYGVFNRMGFFLYRTPKSGSGESSRRRYFHTLTNDRNAIVEGVLAVSGIILALLIYLHGVWFLSLSLLAFGAFTLKSMNLTRSQRSRAIASDAVGAPDSYSLLGVAQGMRARVR
ncbi:MAG TPA: hypothetical protein VEC92_03770, partial [Nitrososphaerales archaeon]|nr:hypothetical protein [Nitrososphaerales archaeon]